MKKEQNGLILRGVPMKKEQEDLREVERYAKLILRFNYIKFDSGISFYASKGGDYEGGFTDKITIECISDNDPGTLPAKQFLSHINKWKRWQVGLTYPGSTYGKDVFDYKKKVRSEKSSEYKAGITRGPEQEAWFVLDSYYFIIDDYGIYGNNTEDEIKKAKDEFFYYGKLCEKLAAHLNTLESWAASGIPMVMQCNERNGPLCLHRANISQEQILTFISKGYTLETMKNKCVCSKCGKRMASFEVPLDVLKYEAMKS